MNWERLALDLQAQWRWQVIHQCAHSRVTFSLPTLADMARIDEQEAADLVREARAMHWVRPHGQGIWVGMLTNFRR